MPKGQLTQWSDVALAELATVDITNLDVLYEWWYANMPPSMHHYIDTIALSALSDAPETRQQMQAILDALGSSEARQNRIFAFFALGALIYFAGGFYYNQYGQPLHAPRGVVVSMSNRLDKLSWERTNLLRDGTLSFDEWQDEMAMHIIFANLAAYLLGSGFDLSEQGIAWISQEIRGELNYFMGMIGDIISGKQRLDGTLGRRMAQYFHTAYTKFVSALSRMLAGRDFTEYRSVLNPAEHCDQCIEEANRGWVPYGMLVPIGSRQCLGNCKCHYEFRNPLTGETYS